MGLPLRRRRRGSRAPSSGTSASRYSLCGTGLRWPIASQSQASNRFFTAEFFVGTPDYAVTDPRVFCPSFWSPASGATEQYIAGGASILLQGWSIETSPGVWTACDGADGAGIATITNAGAGVWLPRIATTLTANSMYRARLCFVVSANGVAIPRVQAQGSSAAPYGQERGQGSTSSLFAKLADNVALTNANAIFYIPSMMIAKGGDGRPAVLALGDSIGYGIGDDTASGAWGARKTFGFVERGLDSNAGAKRFGYHIMAIPGQGACRNDGTGWDFAANWAGKRAALAAVNTEYGAWPFDLVLSQHITNSIAYTADGGDLRVGMGRYYDLLASTWGKPVTQIEGIPASTSTDGWATLANQTPNSGKGFPTANLGHMWTFNADVGSDGLHDATRHYRTAGKIEDSIGAWRAINSANDDRDLWPPEAFATTLAGAYVSGNTIVTAAAPEVGSWVAVQLDTLAWSAARQVTAVTGSGPYTVTLSGTLASGAAIGKPVRNTPGDGLHPSTPIHRDRLAPEIAAWKARRGWV